jgi:hypothetical protein
MVHGAPERTGHGERQAPVAASVAD